MSDEAVDPLSDWPLEVETVGVLEESELVLVPLVPESPVKTELSLFIWASAASIAVNSAFKVAVSAASCDCITEI